MDAVVAVLAFTDPAQRIKWRGGSIRVVTAMHPFSASDNLVLVLIIANIRKTNFILRFLAHNRHILVCRGGEKRR